MKRALLLLVLAAPARADVPRFGLDLEIYTQGRWTSRAGEDLTELRLDRGELGAQVALGPNAAAELRVEAIRSAGEGGTLGVDGDSLVTRVKYANVAGRYNAGSVGLEGALGFVADPWIRYLDDGYTLKPLSRSASERLVGWPSSDLSMVVRAAWGPVRAAVSVGNGEGLRYPERNTGKTTTAVVEVVPLDDKLRVSVAGVARDGSLGVASIRDRRFGGGVHLEHALVRAGGEALRVLGHGNRGEAKGWSFGGWAEARAIDHVFVGARAQTLGFDDGGGRLSTFGGAVAVEPWQAASARLRIWLALERVTTSGGAMPLPGADPGDATLVMLIASAVAPFTFD